MRFRTDDLHGLSVAHRERRTQDLVTLSHLAQTFLERAYVKCAADTHGRRKIVERAALFKFIEKPQTLLSKRERHHIAFPPHSLYAGRNRCSRPQPCCY